MDPMPNPMLTGYPGAMPQPPIGATQPPAQPSPSGNSFMDKFKLAMDTINAARKGGTPKPTQPPMPASSAPQSAMPAFTPQTPMQGQPSAMAPRPGFDVGGEVYGPPDPTNGPPAPDQGLGSWGATVSPAGPSSLDKAADAFKTGNDMIYGNKKDGSQQG